MITPETRKEILLFVLTQANNMVQTAIGNAQMHLKTDDTKQCMAKLGQAFYNAIDALREEMCG